MTGVPPKNRETTGPIDPENKVNHPKSDNTLRGLRTILFIQLCKRPPWLHGRNLVFVTDKW